MEVINHECYVSFEVAKLLKKAGFDWECKKIHFKTGWKGNDDVWELEDNNKKTKLVLELDYCLLAPTLEVVQRWLREVKNCYVGVEVFVHNLDKNNIYYTYNWIVYLDGDRYSGSDIDTTRYYEVVQETSIKKALELILEKGE